MLNGARARGPSAPTLHFHAGPERPSRLNQSPVTSHARPQESYVGASGLDLKPSSPSQILYLDAPTSSCPRRGRNQEEGQGGLIEEPLNG